MDSTEHSSVSPIMFGTKNVLIYFILRTMQKKDVISMDRKQIHELVNHSLNELHTRADEAGTAGPHFPACMAGFLTVLRV